MNELTTYLTWYVATMQASACAWWQLLVKSLTDDKAWPFSVYGGLEAEKSALRLNNPPSK